MYKMPTPFFLKKKHASKTSPFVTRAQSKPLFPGIFITEILVEERERASERANVRRSVHATRFAHTKERREKRAHNFKQNSNSNVVLYLIFDASFFARARH